MKRSALISLIIVIFIFMTGGCINPVEWEEQVEHRFNPSSLVSLDEETLHELEAEFVFFNYNVENGTIAQCFNGETTIFHDLYCFISNKITYRSDISNFYCIDYLATPKQTLIRGADDCDGKAALICTMLVKRGYDAYVVMGTKHTWVEVHVDDLYVYISHIGSTDQIIISPEPISNENTWYVKFNANEAQWRIYPLVYQGALVFFYLFFVFLLSQVILIKRLYSKPVSYISEMAGYFRYILYLFMLFFCIWIVILLLVKLLSEMS
ncbi:MAG: hypothetical protein ACXQT0_05460 [Candidatus Methanofastidiosia archaeon]